MWLSDRFERFACLCAAQDSPFYEQLARIAAVVYGLGRRRPMALVEIGTRAGLNLLWDILAKVPHQCTLCVYHGSVLYQFTPHERSQFESLLAAVRPDICPTSSCLDDLLTTSAYVFGRITRVHHQVGVLHNEIVIVGGMVRGDQHAVLLREEVRR